MFSKSSIACGFVSIPLGAFLVLFFFPVKSSGQTDAVRGSIVEVGADVAATSPCVTLHWNASHFPATGITVYRRNAGQTDWGTGTVLPPSTLSYPDPTAAANQRYEYRVVRNQENSLPAVAEGFLWSGFDIPATEARGRLILVVENSVSTPLTLEIARFIEDLTGDGWQVTRLNHSRSETVVQIKTAIQTTYQTDPSNYKAVILLGRITVPYSGIICPDGHSDPPPGAHHRGAWPADVFYGDMDGIWTDTTVDHAISNVSGTRNYNTPGDGKYDQSLISGDFLPEMVVGRIDLANMGGLSSGYSETDLLRQYLNRHHRFRHRLAPFATLGERAMIDDNFGHFGGLAFAASGWGSGVALFGNQNTSEQDWVPTLRDNNYLLAYGCGPGTFGSAGSVSGITDFRDTRCRAVLNLLFGSFFGDWDSGDNYLRAPLAGTPESHGLVSLWSGVPRWQLFPLAAGGTIADAYAHVISEVNQTGGPFPPTDDSWTNPDQTHVAIMGDPVLRLHPVKPVGNLSASVNDGRVTLSWTNPVGEPDLLGCRIYRATSPSGPFSPVGSQTDTQAVQFIDPAPAEGTYHYMVRAIKRQTTASASYLNPAQGILVEIAVPAFGYDAWSSGLGDPVETGDPNGDGIPNLIAYAVGAPDGETDATAFLPRATDVETYQIDRSGRIDVLYEIQLSHELSTWFPVARKPPGGSWTLNAASGYPSQANLTLSETSTASVSDSSPVANRFWRLRVELN